MPSNISLYSYPLWGLFKHLLLLGRILVSKWGLRPNIRVQAFAPHIYHLKKLFCQLYNIILQYIQHPNFYFPILLIKIIYPKIIIIYNTTHYLFSLSFFLFKNDHKFTETTIITSPPPLHYTHLTPPLLHYTYLTPPPPPPS